MPDQKYDALLVVSFGGPEGQDEVMPFLENVLRGKSDHSATVTMHNVRGFLQFHTSLSTDINLRARGYHGTYRNVSGTYRNVLGRTI